MPKVYKELLRYGSVFIPGFFILFYRQGSFWASYWWVRWDLLLAIFSIYFAYAISRKTSLWLFPVLIVTLLSAANAAVSPSSEISNKLPPPVFLESTRHALYAYITVLAVGLTWVSLPATFAKAVRSFLVSTFWISVVLTLVQWSFEKPRLRYGITGNGGINATLIAALLPMAIQNFRLWLKAIVIAVVVFVCFLTQTSNGVGSILVALCLMATCNLWTWLGIGGAGLLIGSVIQQKGDDLFKIHDRIDIWRMVYHWWKPIHPWLFGSGYGTSPPILVYLGQEQKDPMIYFFGHSDWLQFAWETGVVGLVALLIAWTWFALKARCKRELFVAFMVLSAGAVFNFPARLPVTFLAGLLISWLILQEKETAVEESLPRVPSVAERFGS